MPKMPAIPAAQYLRMSTEDQPNSIPTQRNAIQKYATDHGFEIVETYSDPGKSGLGITNRPGLTHLLRDVVSGDCQFRAILVFDVSRWGRFQDTDESGHYEFLCRRAGIQVHYCAEQFENDNKLPNAIMKTLKRSMAAEYSRELSLKITAAQRRMAAEGYHVGGSAGYGLRRMLVGADGQRKQVLQTGECKNLKSEHVVLVPGPKDEVECVRTIFKLAAEKRNSPRVIAQKLNQRKLLYSDHTPWDYLRVSDILKNERFIGSTVWGMRDTRFDCRPQPHPPSEWVIKREAFPAIVTPEQFAAARKQIQGRSCNPGSSRKDILDQLAKILLRDKAESRVLSRKRRRLTNRWRHRFGSILEAYGCIGYKPRSHVVNSTTAFWKIRSLKTGLFQELKNLFSSRVRMVRRFRQPRFRILEIDNRMQMAVYICRPLKPYASGEPRWKIGLRPKHRHLPALICLPNPELSRLTNFYLVRDLGNVNAKYKVISSDHPWLTKDNQLDSLVDLCRQHRYELGVFPFWEMSFSLKMTQP
jgi:DNA invertase Pin-like site-specific DNA recombinase